MKQTDNLDELINKYSSELLTFGSRYSHPPAYQSVSYDDTDEKEPVAENEEETDRQIQDEDKAEAQEKEDEKDKKYELKEKEEMHGDSDDEEEHEEDLYFARRLPRENYYIPGQTAPENPSQLPSSENPKENPENFATFTARIFAAEGALPVEGAKVIVKRQGEIHSYLLTNGSGETRTVKLESYPEENSREPFNPDKQTVYTADIHADGFESKTDLLVEATGGSAVILQQFMVPVQQGGI